MSKLDLIRTDNQIDSKELAKNISEYKNLNLSEVEAAIIKEQFANLEDRAEKTSGWLISYLDTLAKDYPKQVHVNFLLVQLFLKTQGIKVWVDWKYGRETEGVLLAFYMQKNSRYIPSADKQQAAGELRTAWKQKEQEQRSQVSPETIEQRKLAADIWKHNSVEYKEEKYAKVTKENLYNWEKHKAFRDFILTTPWLSKEQVTYINTIWEKFKLGWVQVFSILTKSNDLQLGKNLTEEEWEKKWYDQYDGIFSIPWFGSWTNSNELIELNFVKDLYLSNPDFKKNVDKVSKNPNPIKFVTEYMNSKQIIESNEGSLNLAALLSDLNSDWVIDEDDAKHMLSGQRLFEFLKKESNKKILKAINVILKQINPAYSKVEINTHQQLAVLLGNIVWLKNDIYNRLEQIDALGPTSLQDFFENPNTWPKNTNKANEVIENSPYVVEFKNALWEDVVWSAVDMKISELKSKLSNTTDPQKRQQLEAMIDSFTTSRPWLIESTKIYWQGILVSFIKDNKGLGTGVELTNELINEMLRKYTKDIVKSISVEFLSFSWDTWNSYGVGLRMWTKEFKLTDTISTQVDAWTVLMFPYVAVTLSATLNKKDIEEFGFSENKALYKLTITPTLGVWQNWVWLGGTVGVFKDRVEWVKVQKQALDRLLKDLIKTDVDTNLNLVSLIARWRATLTEETFMKKHLALNWNNKEKNIQYIEEFLDGFANILRNDKYDEASVSERKTILNRRYDYLMKKFDSINLEKLEAEWVKFKWGGVSFLFGVILPFLVWDKVESTSIDDEASKIGAQIAMIEWLGTKRSDIERLQHLGIDISSENGLLVLSAKNWKDIFDIEGLNIVYHPNVKNNIQYINGKLVLGNVGKLITYHNLRQRDKSEYLIIGDDSLNGEVKNLKDIKKELVSQPTDKIPTQSEFVSEGGESVGFGDPRLAQLSKFVKSNESLFSGFASKHSSEYLKIQQATENGDYHKAVVTFLAIVKKENFKWKAELSSTLNDYVKAYEWAKGKDEEAEEVYETMLGIALAQILDGMMGDKNPLHKMNKKDFHQAMTRRWEWYKEVLEKNGLGPKVDVIKGYRDAVESSYSPELHQDSSIFWFVATYRKFGDKKHRAFNAIPPGMVSYRGRIQSIEDSFIQEDIVDKLFDLPSAKTYKNTLKDTVAQVISQSGVDATKLSDDQFRSLLKIWELEIWGKTVKIERDFVFFLYWTCNNESMWIRIKGLKVGTTNVGLQFKEWTVMVNGQPLWNTKNYLFAVWAWKERLFKKTKEWGNGKGDSNIGWGNQDWTVWTWWESF